MHARNWILGSLVTLGMVGTLQAQAQPPQTVRGTPEVATVKMTGEVVRVQGNWLLAKMEPLGNLSLFDVQPGREFIVDGQPKHIADLRPGTVLTGSITTKTTPVDAATEGDASFAALTKQSLATGQVQTALTVTGIKGNLAVTAVKAGPSVTQQASAELTKLINTILAHG